MSRQDTQQRPSKALSDRARALAVILQEEFSTSFIFYDPTTGAEVWRPNADGQDLLNVCLQPDAVLTMTAAGRSRVVALSEHRYQLTLLLYESTKPVFVATGAVPALAMNEPARSLEIDRLQHWLQSVSDRLRLCDQLLRQRRDEEDQASQVATAWEAMLTLDQVMRHMRIHKDSLKSQQRILEGVFRLLKVQSLLWVPQQPDANVLLQGERCLAAADCRQLVNHLTKEAGFQAGAPLFCHDVQATIWGSRYPRIINLMAFQVMKQGPLGWLIAINKENSDSPRPREEMSSFRRGHAVLMMPFVALLELQARGVQRYQDLKELLVGLTRSLTSALDAKDSYTYGHSERVARIAVELGREMGLDGDGLGDVYLAGLLHDVGKIGVRDAILCKATALTSEELEHIKQHVTIGYKILSDLRPIRNLLPGVLYHHERYDGKGYPDGLVGENIPLLARILAVADSYDAMSTARPYRDAIPCRRVEEILVDGSGQQWDSRIVEAFMRCRHKIHSIRQRGVGESLYYALDAALRSTEGSNILNADLIANSPPVKNRK